MQFLHKIDKIKKFKTFLQIIGWSAGGSLIALVCVPAMTRLYDPAALGLLGIIVAAANTLAPFVTGRYEESLLLTRTPSTANSVLWLAILLASIISLIFFLFSAIYFSLSLDLGAYAFYVPAFALTFALFSLTQRCFLRFNIDDWVGKQAFLRSAAVSTLPLISAISLSSEPALLLLTTLLCNILAIAIAVYVLAKRNGLKRQAVHFPGWAAILETGRLFSNMPKFNAPHAALNATVAMSPQLVIAHEFGLEAAGMYVIANRLISAPIALINQASTSINSKIIATNRSTKGSRALLGKVVMRSGIFSLLVLILIWIAQDYFALFLGSSWMGIEIYLLLLCPYLFSALSAGSVTYVTVAYSKQRGALILEVLSLVIRLGSLMLGARIGGIYWALAMFSFASLLMAATTLFWYERVMRHSHA